MGRGVSARNTALPSRTAIRSHSSRNRSWRRAVTTTFAPFAAKASAAAQPMPELAPVIRTVFPARLIASGIFD